MLARKDELLAIYCDVYAHLLDNPFSTPERYWARIADGGYAARDGFRLVFGWVAGEIVGYSFGFTLPKGARWWRGLKAPVTPELTMENGRRTYALTELAVRGPWRRQGYGRALHDALLRGRPEERATLLVRPGNQAARSAYHSWGWKALGELQPAPEAPVFHALLLPLQAAGSTATSRATNTTAAPPYSSP